MSMVLADGLLVIPEDVMQARAGEKFTVRLLRSVE
jgi:molybdopterin biosynthesis enzyme